MRRPPPRPFRTISWRRPRAIGDPAAGQELFNTGLEGIPHEHACATCHTLDGVDGRSPSLQGIWQIAGERVEGVSDVEYLRQSIVDPYAFESDDWPDVMPYEYADLLCEEEVDDLVAFLLTQ